MTFVLADLPGDLRYAADLIEREDHTLRLRRFIDALRYKADAISVDPTLLETAREMSKFFADVAQRGQPAVMNRIYVEECQAVAQIIDQLLGIIGPVPLTDGEFTGQHTGD